MSTQMNTLAPAILLSTHLCCRPGARRYWSALATRMVGKVDLIDPCRVPLRTLRAQHPEWRGLRLYRASTGGKWGRSSEIVTL